MNFSFWLLLFLLLILRIYLSLGRTEACVGKDYFILLVCLRCIVALVKSAKISTVAFCRGLLWRRQTSDSIRGGRPHGRLADHLLAHLSMCINSVLYAFMTGFFLHLPVLIKWAYRGLFIFPMILCLAHDLLWAGWVVFSPFSFLSCVLWRRSCNDYIGVKVHLILLLYRCDIAHLLWSSCNILLACLLQPMSQLLGSCSTHWRRSGPIILSLLIIISSDIRDRFAV